MSYYRINEEDFAETSPEEIQDFKVEEYQLESEYNEVLDDIYGEVEIAGIKFWTARALQDLDPIAHREGFLDWINAEIDSGVLFED